MEEKNLESITENIDDKVQAASVTDENLMGDMGEERSEKNKPTRRARKLIRK